MSQIKFEEAMKKLENIVSSLESENLALEESLGKYEEGVKLSQLCIKKLEEARRKIQTLSKLESGKMEAKPFVQEGLKDAAEGHISKESQAPAARNKGKNKISGSKQEELPF